MPIRVLHVVGARPNFMKIAPVMNEMANYPELFSQMLIHTGQHYAQNMSAVFFDELGLPTPDINLGVGSASHASQTGQIMISIEKVLLDYKPDWIIVPGDVNSTLACALVASKMGVRIAHVEAGLRSFDRTMPEEINRLLTDQLSDMLLTPSRDADDNLLREGIAPEKIHFVGNVMIDTLIKLLPKAEKKWPILRRKFNLQEFVLVTLHRPSNVDVPDAFSSIWSALCEISLDIPVVFPIHPRTRKQMTSMLIESPPANLFMIEPLGYLDFLSMEKHARLILTDSGGVQEETTYLGIPCITLRENTERPVTIHQGTNKLFAGTSSELVTATKETINRNGKRAYRIPPLWDGQTASRIVKAFIHAN